MVIGFAAIALVWGYGAAILGDAAGLEPVIVPATFALLVAGVAWMRRGRDVLDVVVPAFVVAYAAYVGLAAARAPGTTIASLYNIGSLAGKWPLLLTAGVPFALISTVAVAVPVSLIPRRRTLDPHADEAFWTFVRTRVAGFSASARREGEPVSPR
jgi:hypothetical protein